MLDVFCNLKVKIDSVKWLYQKAHNGRLLLWNNPLHRQCNFSSVFSDSDIDEKIRALNSGMDGGSQKVISEVLDTYRYLTMAKIERAFIEFALTPEEANLANEYKKLKNIKHHGDNDVFYFHHGLKFANDKILDYIKNKIFIDAGAFHGESSVIFAEYEPSLIYAFEMSGINVKKISSFLRKNKIKENLVTIVNKAVGATECVLNFADTGSSGCSLMNSGRNTVECVSLDNYCRERKNKIGFIKGDLEGAGMDMVRGMKNIIVEDRPVISIGVYHSPEEFFDIKPFIENLNADYCFEMRRHSDRRMFEIDLMAYPRELKE